MFGWKYPGLTILSLFLSTLLSLSPAKAGDQIDLCPKFDWGNVPSNQWVRLSTCGDAPRKVFHGASALAADRNEIFFFGADTHDKDYDNSVYRIHLGTLEWSKDYKADPIEEYLLTEDGYAVTTTGRPWAMHTFDAGCLLAKPWPLQSPGYSTRRPHLSGLSAELPASSGHC